MLGQGGVNCWGALSKCREWELRLLSAVGIRNWVVVGELECEYCSASCVSYNPCVDC